MAKMFRGSKRHLSDKGFTLVEIMIVIAIIGILSVMGVPIFRSFLHRIRLSAASRFIASCARMARTHSVTDSRDIRFEVYTYDATGTGKTGISGQNLIATLRRTSIADSVDNWERLAPASGPMPEGINIAAYTSNAELSSATYNRGSSSPNTNTMQMNYRGSVTNAQAILVTYLPESEISFPIAENNDKYHTIVVNNMSGRVKIIFYARGWSN